MKTPPALHLAAARCGRLTLALTALAVALLSAGSTLASVIYGNPGNFGGAVVIPGNSLQGIPITVTAAGTLEAFGTQGVTQDHLAQFALYAANGGAGEPGTLVALTTIFSTSGIGMEVPPTAPVALAPGDYWIMAVYFEDTTVPLIGGPSRSRPLAFGGGLPAAFGPATVGNFSFGYFIKVGSPPPPVNALVYVKGDAVPGAGATLPPFDVPAGATFTGFGVPTLNDAGTIAVLGKWSSPSGSGSGIFSGSTLVVKIGSFAGIKIKSLKDPVIDNAGHVAFLAKLGDDPAHDSAIMTDATGGLGLGIAAMEGNLAADVEAIPGSTGDAVFKSFTSVALPGGGHGVVFVAQLQRGPGGITAANDSGIWTTAVSLVPGTAPVLRGLLQKGVTVIEGRTVKTFTVLKAVSGSPGQTHAFNHNGEVVAKVIFTDGAQGVVHLSLP